MVAFRHLSAEEREQVKARQIVCNVAREHGFDLALLRSACRRADLVRARRDAAAQAYSRTVVTESELGRILNRNHSTIHRGLQTMGVVV